MTLPHETYEELHELIGSLCDGSIDEARFARLQSLLAADIEAQRFYVRYLDLHGALGRLERGNEGSGFRVQSSEPVVSRQWSVVSDERTGPDTYPCPTIHYPLSTFHSSVSTFIGGILFSYLTAALVVGLGLLVAWAWKLPERMQIAQDQAIPATSVMHPDEEPTSVGRITGMVDCVWKKGSEFRVQGSDAVRSKARGPRPKTLVSLGDTIALSSGLLEITYDTGAKVILQGPVTYEVNSAAGGFLSVGKLTARVEAKGSGFRVQGSETANQKSEIRNRKSSDLWPLTSDLFVVRTPTATVTDLGTEFGVEVDSDGVTETHVFEGRVVAARPGHDGHTAMSQTLSVGQGMRIETDRMTMISQQGHGQALIRSMPRRRTPVTFLEPTPYQSFDNRDATPNISPFSKAAGGPFGPLSGDKGQRHWIGPQGQYFYLEDLESGDVRATGLSIEGWRVVGVNNDPKATDPVDEDDGSIDEATHGNLAHSVFACGDGRPIRISFDVAVLGQLPTYVGFVITDCRPEVNTIIEAFDASHRSLGKTKVFNVEFATGEYACGPDAARKARFVGVICNNSCGVASLVVSEVHPNGRPADAGIEVDHIQYGFAGPKVSPATDDDSKPVPK